MILEDYLASCKLGTMQYCTNSKCSIYSQTKKIPIVSEAMETVETAEVAPNCRVLTCPHELSLLEVQNYLDLLFVFVSLTYYYPGRLDHSVWNANGPSMLEDYTTTE